MLPCEFLNNFFVVSEPILWILNDFLRMDFVDNSLCFSCMFGMRINLYLVIYKITANMLNMARVELLLYSQTSEDIAIINKAKDHLGTIIRTFNFSYVLLLC